MVAWSDGESADEEGGVWIELVPSIVGRGAVLAV